MEIVDNILNVGLTVVESFTGIFIGNTLGGLFPGELGGFVGDSLGNIVNTMFFDTAKEIISRHGGRSKSKYAAVSRNIQCIHSSLTLGYRPPPPKYHYQPPPPRQPRTTRPPRQRTSEKPVEVILTAVQASTPRPNARSGSKPAFKLANKTSMNLDGPGYALTLLLVGK